MDKEAEEYKKEAHGIIGRKGYFKFVRIFENTTYGVYNLKSDIIENGNLAVRN